jgi:hypothetical protein
MILWWLDTAPRAGPLLLCGTAVGITSSVILHKGLLLYVALVAILLLQKVGRSKLLAVGQLTAGTLAVILAFAGYFWSQGALRDLYYATFI